MDASAAEHETLEISAHVDDALASWSRTIGNRQPDVDPRPLFAKAAAELGELFKIDRTVYPEREKDTFQCIVDDLSTIGLGAGIDTDEVQRILADNLRGQGQRNLSEEIPGDEPFERGAAPDQTANNPGRLSLVAASTLHGVEIQRRRWLASSRIPMRAVTILSGDGASGKTTILMQLSAAVVLQRDWLGLPVEEHGPVMFITAEEDADEVHRRLAAIAEHYGVGFSDLSHFHFACLSGEDSLLCVAQRDGTLRATPLFERIEEAARRIRPRLICIEAAADVYGGDENVRGQVRQFIQLLRRLALAADAAVVLIQHPSVMGMQEGQGRSGSTGWRNSARAQLYFASAKRGDDDQESDVRELRVVKSNYSRAGDTIAVRWERGVFIPTGAQNPIDRAVAEADIDALFLRLLDEFTVAGRAVRPSESRSGAPQQFANHPAARERRVSAKALKLSMERLLAARRIVVVNSGPPSKQTQSLARPSEPPSEVSRTY
jgi:RecA-family ATPase